MNKPLNPLLTSILVASFSVLAACSTKGSDAAKVQSVDLDSPSAMLASAHLAVDTTISHWLCGGAAPSHGGHGGHTGPCVEYKPVAMTFALVLAKDETGQDFDFVKYISTDATGHLDLDLAPGRYTFKTKYQITKDMADYNYANIQYIEPIALEKGDTKAVSIQFTTPPPPISIGVGN